MSVSASFLSLAEDGAGSTGTFTVVLLAKPTADVTFTLTSTDGSVISVSPDTFTFVRDEFSTPKTVTVSAVNNALLDGNRSAQITLATSSSDTNFQLALDPVVVEVASEDRVSGGAGGAPGLPLLLSSQGRPLGACTCALRALTVLAAQRAAGPPSNPSSACPFTQPLRCSPPCCWCP